MRFSSVDTSDPMPKKPRLAVDWDSTVVEGVWPRHDGDWLPDAVESLQRLDKTFEIVIWSCRVAPCAYPSASLPIFDIPRPEAEVTEEVYGIKAKLKEIGLGHVEVWERPYKPPALAYVDDRAMRLERFETGDTNWSLLVEDLERQTAETSEVGIGGNETLPTGFAMGSDGIPTSSIEVGDLVKVTYSDYWNGVGVITKIHDMTVVEMLTGKAAGTVGGFRSHEIELVSKAMAEQPELDMPDDEDEQAVREAMEYEGLVPPGFAWDMKPTNPKDAVGSDKLPLHLWPETATAVGCLGLLDGMLKYGRSNWRETGVRFSIYIDAVRRHLNALFEGEDLDPDSGLPHLSHALACLAILVDAEAAGKLTDDRQYPGGYRALVEELTPHVPRLKERHAGRDPKHWTIADEVA